MRIIDLFQEFHDTRLFTGGGNTISQSFIPRRDNLSSVRVTVYNPKLGGSAKYRFVLKNEKDETIREQTATESNMGWESEFRMDFEPVLSSKNKKFTISIEEDGQDESKNEGIIVLNEYNLGKSGMDKVNIDKFDSYSKNFPSFAYSKKDRYGDGKALLNQMELAGDFSFKTYYSTDLAGFSSDSLNGFFWRAGLDPGFFIFFAILTISLTITILKRKKRRQT